ncbi:MAG: hypothetical protein Q8L65_02760, partial [Burkholderiales bacterium]|nr:hypothetical protein [Burkholderiales bacterium]
MDWQRFVASYGWRANGHHLAQVVGQPVEVVLKLRDTGICRRLKRARTFDELFQLWHGRPPRDEEWPKPRRRHGKGYEWLQNELALLATLVGTIGKAQIAQALTARLQRATGDRHAERSQQAVQVAINRIGLVSRDVLGGITAPAAAREIGSYSTVHHAIRSGRLTPFRIGKLWVIPHDQWQRFKADRPPPPAGYVMLSSIRQRLGISSDAKLPEYAAMGYIPTAVLCNPKLGAGHSSSVRGSWYVDRRV